MPANAHPEFIFAEREYGESKTIEEKIVALEKMISFAPAHKGGENLRAQLKTRYKNLLEKQEKNKKSGKSTQQGIKKGEMQAVLVGPPNTGKSTIFKELTNQETIITDYPHSTTGPVLGTIKFEDVKIQLIDLPSFPNSDKGIINSADTLIIVIDDLTQIEECKKQIEKSNAKKIWLFNKIDTKTHTEKRKLEETLKSKHKNLNFFLINRDSNFENIKLAIFKSFPIIRVYTKEPKKPHSKDPMILKKESTLGDAAEKISKSLRDKTKSAKIWGPSSKFGGQTVGINHTLKDKDIIEIKTF